MIYSSVSHEAINSKLRGLGLHKLERKGVIKKLTQRHVVERKEDRKSGRQGLKDG